jgi:hypothetical protein
LIPPPPSGASQLDGTDDGNPLGPFQVAIIPFSWSKGASY